MSRSEPVVSGDDSQGQQLSHQNQCEHQSSNKYLDIDINPGNNFDIDIDFETTTRQLPFEQGYNLLLLFMKLLDKD